MVYTVTVFQLGSGTVITLPKDFGLRPGQKLRVRKEKRRIIMVEKKLDAEEIARRHSGKLKLKYDPTPEEFNKALDERYEKMLL